MDLVIDRFPVLCRSALAKDTGDVLELTSHIWEGDDYIPSVWEDWLEDSDGLLAVAECGGRVVGLAKLTRFACGDWFMEGLRVHPDLQSKGIARRLNDYLLAYWYKYGEGSVRLATASYNFKVHHLCERSGFQRIVEYIPYSASALFDGSDRFDVITHDELLPVIDFAQQSDSFLLTGGLLDLGWRWARINVQHLKRACGAGYLWWWRGEEGLLGVWLDEEDDERRLKIMVAVCAIDQFRELLMDYRRLGARLGKARVGWTAPAHPVVEAALQQAGFERSWDDSIFIYELTK